jgi:predicted ArsR family transcriptional regulator
MDEAFGRRATKVAALADPVRRALYRFVAEQPGAVSRDQAATGVEVPRHTAKFHLDKLVEEGLLVTEFRRLTGRSGPGAGRPAKLYRRSRKEVSVSLPSRRYDLAGQVLADAVERTLAGVPMTEALGAAADGAAAIVAEALGPPAGGTTDGRNRLTATLDPLGYEPRTEDAGDGDGEVRMGNCPYDRLAADHRGLVCGMNQSFVTALGRHLDCRDTAVEPVEPGAGCCVRLVRRTP